MAKYYSDEKNAQIVVALLKKHGIKKVVGSPGTTNMSFIVSVQSDPYFELYSSVDERSAAYIACGLSAESGEPVVISCTGATASRNYLSGLTEAYYRKLPILAITSTQPNSMVGHHIPQVIDRRVMPNDTVNLSLELPIVNSSDEFWDCEIKTNQAILELSHKGGGPVHLNLATSYGDFTTTELPKVRVIKRISPTSVFPEMPKGKIAVFIGSHAKMSKNLTEKLDEFCAANNAVVFCDHTSSYKGKYRLLYALVAGQITTSVDIGRPDLIIHIGEVSGDYYGMRMVNKNVWRVSEDGLIRVTFKKLSYIFEMPISSFFEHYAKSGLEEANSYLNECKQTHEDLYSKIPELPYSNIWMASKMSKKVPENSVIHFSILNSLRSWNFFEIPESVSSMSNVGGFGIDGCLSSLIGASLNNKNKLFFGVIGDLAFFYDMNVLGNRHVGSNVRILLVNNGVGIEFKQFSHRASEFGAEANKFVAAAGHFGEKSKSLAKNYVESLGFKYMTASNKEEFSKTYEDFLSEKESKKPILFEVFTNEKDESLALEKILNIEENFKGKAKKIVKQVISKSSFVGGLKKVIGKK